MSITVYGANIETHNSHPMIWHFLRTMGVQVNVGEKQHSATCARGHGYLLDWSSRSGRKFK
jgi:hypothetical protein